MALPISDDTPPDLPAKRKPARPDWLVGANEGLEAEIARSEEQEKSAPPALGRKDQGPTPGRLPDMDEAHGPIIPHPVRPVELPGGFSADVGGISAAPGYLPGELESGPPAPRAAAGYEAAVERTPPPPARPAYIMEPHPIHEAKFPLGAPAVEPKITIRPTLRQQLTRVGKLLRPALPWVAGALVSGFAVMFLLRAIGVGTTSVRSILKNPGRWDGQAVRVRGRVGDDVFPLGAGSSFYLLQGRDTLVVFSRSRVPTVHEPLEIPGIVSSGVLNGTLRPALLEQVGKQ
jgi:hypothetical protein